jgi:hypothetical protein
MKNILSSAAMLVALILSPGAFAQVSADTLQGAWTGTMRGACKKVTFTILKVEESGTVRGSYFCSGLKWSGRLSEKPGANVLGARFVDGKFLVDAADGAHFEFVVNPMKMEGWSREANTEQKSPLTLVKM